MNNPVYIGIAGWSYPDWKGIVYTKSNIDQLEYVARFVDVIEINNTFYRPPEARICKSWLSKVAGFPDFFFTAKLHKDFTHEGKLDQEMVKQFHYGFEPMLETGKLKQLLAQFRYDFDDTADNRSHLQKIIHNFGKSFDIAVEVRHSSWQQSEALKFLDDLQVSVCNLDYPPSSTAFDKTCIVGKHGYFRLHGRNAEKWFSKDAGRDEVYNYYYNEKELDEIKQRIEKLSTEFQRLTVIANNHYRGGELANALELKWILTGAKQIVPDGLIKQYPQLARIAGKTNLF
ncbi:MAG: hypothetical protein A2Y10_08730 [Planctomycetes bacterium GWF2_41_51]|nr:MAG: hypothetical protein A2Y10_08730 [Planctomycetes bacterium GWF2_41_51]HBG28360.1 hypothetical protein [Phycisphaerales bacterium]